MTTRPALIQASHFDAARDVIDAQDAAWRRIDEAAGRVEPRQPLRAKASQPKRAPAQPAKIAGRTEVEPPRIGTGIDRSATKRAGRVEQGRPAGPGREKPNQGVEPGGLVLSAREVEALDHLLDQAEQAGLLQPPTRRSR
jgi:hypothetical protein